MSGRLVLITGGSGSGKSAFAEQRLLAEAAAGHGRAVYLATMENRGAEARARVARHRAMRARHGAELGVAFHTLERSVDIGGAAVLPGDYVLLEDLGNLLAGELWAPGGAASPEKAEERILAGIRSLLDRAAVVAAVGNDIAADGGDYDGDTLAYIRSLGRVQSALAAEAEEVYEVVCGIPVRQK